MHNGGSSEVGTGTPYYWFLSFAVVVLVSNYQIFRRICRVVFKAYQDVVAAEGEEPVMAKLEATQVQAKPLQDSVQAVMARVKDKGGVSSVPVTEADAKSSGDPAASPAIGSGDVAVPDITELVQRIKTGERRDDDAVSVASRTERQICPNCGSGRARTVEGLVYCMDCGLNLTIARTPSLGGVDAAKDHLTQLAQQAMLMSNINWRWTSSYQQIVIKQLETKGHAFGEFWHEGAVQRLYIPSEALAAPMVGPALAIIKPQDATGNRAKWIAVEVITVFALPGSAPSVPCVPRPMTPVMEHAQESAVTP